MFWGRWVGGVIWIVGCGGGGGGCLEVVGVGGWMLGECENVHTLREKEKEIVCLSEWFKGFCS